MVKRLITVVITILVVRECAALEREAFQFQPEMTPSFTCGGFSESSAGYLRSRRTLESCKNINRLICVRAKLEHATGVSHIHLLLWSQHTWKRL